ncbi:MAG: LptE family protein [Deltaproteobacteria bacterium]|nr:LptE family protein [Deltaproteobacteria bacterium]
MWARPKKYFPVLVMLLLVLALCACGYRLRGTGELRPDLKRVAFVPFVNQTVESHVEDDLYDALAGEFARSKNLQVVAVADADLLLSGTITAIASSAISYSPDDKTYEYRVAMTIDVVATEARTQEVFWRRSGMQEVDEYKAVAEPLLIDRRRQAALKRICQVLAENIHDGLFTDF